jgi:hypothetical protein
MANGIIIGTGDTRIPFAAVCLRNGKPEDVAAYTVKFVMKDKGGTEVVAETSDNVSKQPTFAFTASTTTKRLTVAGHRVENGDRIIVSTTGTLPSGLSASTKYYVRDCDDDSFRLAATPDGQPIQIASSGSGTHSAYIVGEVMYAPQSSDVDTAGEYRAWFRLYSGSDPSTAPVGQGIPVFILDRSL